MTAVRFLALLAALLPSAPAALADWQADWQFVTAEKEGALTLPAPSGRD